MGCCLRAHFASQCRPQTISLPIKGRCKVRQLISVNLEGRSWAGLDQGTARAERQRVDADPSTLPGLRDRAGSIHGTSVGSSRLGRLHEGHPWLVLSWGLSDGSTYEKLIPWSYTQPRFGGERRWFKCDCNRRCRVIYFASSGWRCRRCYRLAYQCQREDRGQRCQRRANKIIKRLGEDLYDDCYPPKPKWMRWRTYNRLCDQADEFARRGTLGA